MSSAGAAAALPLCAEAAASIALAIDEIIQNNEDPGGVLPEIEMLEGQAAAAGGAPRLGPRRVSVGGVGGIGGLMAPLTTAQAAAAFAAGGAEGGGSCDNGPPLRPEPLPWQQLQLQQQQMMMVGSSGIERQSTLAALYEIDARWLEEVDIDSDGDLVFSGQDSTILGMHPEASTGLSSANYEACFSTDASLVAAMQGLGTVSSPCTGSMPLPAGLAGGSYDPGSFFTSGIVSTPATAVTAAQQQLQQQQQQQQQQQMLLLQQQQPAPPGGLYSLPDSVTVPGQQAFGALGGDRSFQRPPQLQVQMSAAHTPGLSEGHTGSVQGPEQDAQRSPPLGSAAATPEAEPAHSSITSGASNAIAAAPGLAPQLQLLQEALWQEQQQRRRLGPDAMAQQQQNVLMLQQRARALQRAPLVHGAAPGFHSAPQPYGFSAPCVLQQQQQPGRPAGDNCNYDIGKLQELMVTQEMEEEVGLISSIDLPGIMRVGSGAPGDAAPQQRPQPQQQPQLQQQHAPSFAQQAQAGFGAGGQQPPQRQHQGKLAEKFQGFLAKTAAFLGASGGGSGSGRAGAGAGAGGEALHGSGAQAHSNHHQQQQQQQGGPCRLASPEAPVAPAGAPRKAPASNFPPLPYGASAPANLLHFDGSAAPAAAAAAAPSQGLMMMMSGGAPSLSQEPSDAAAWVSGPSLALCDDQQQRQRKMLIFKRRPDRGAASSGRLMTFSRERMISSAMERQHAAAASDPAAAKKSGGGGTSASGGGAGRGRARRRPVADDGAPPAALASSLSDQLPVLRNSSSCSSFPSVDGAGLIGRKAGGRTAGEKRTSMDLDAAWASHGTAPDDSSKKLHSCFLDFLSHAPPNGAPQGGGPGGGWQLDDGGAAVAGLMSCPMNFAPASFGSPAAAAVPASMRSVLSCQLPPIPEGLMSAPLLQLQPQGSANSSRQQQQQAVPAWAAGGAAEHCGGFGLGPLGGGAFMSAPSNVAWSAPLFPPGRQQ